MSALEHLRGLAALGPRPSGSPAEAAAADYAATALRAAGLEPRVEQFVSARSAWYPYAAFAGLALLGEVVFLAGGTSGAAAAFCLTLFGLGAGLLELTFRANPLRWILPRVDSQNVVARIAPRDAARARVVLLGHLDTHRTPLVFSSDGWLRLFEKLVPLGLVSVLLLAVLEALAAAGVRGPWHLVSLPFGFVAAGLLVLFVQADLTPYTEGANDNASGVAVVLDLARRLRAEPLATTEVWAVLTGCEEVGCYGAFAFAAAHRADLGGAAWIAIDSVGGHGAGPIYLTRETFLLPAPSDPGLVRLAERVAARRPELGLRGTTASGAYTEGCVGGRCDCRVLTFLAFDVHGLLPEWHRVTDVVANVDPEVVERTESAVWDLLHDFDAEAAGSGAASAAG
ncbi:MAG: M28 family peptidase [Deltaproteobacteria bacterium]|nr:M28 family peptidase [Deltaproteobacteria bacterium]